MRNVVKMETRELSGGITKTVLEWNEELPKLNGEYHKFEQLIDDSIRYVGPKSSINGDDRPHIVNVNWKGDRRGEESKPSNPPKHWPKAKVIRQMRTAGPKSYQRSHLMFHSTDNMDYFISHIGHCRRWTDPEVFALLAMFQKGMSDEEIAEILDRTKDGVRVKRYFMGKKGYPEFVTRMNPVKRRWSKEEILAVKFLDKIGVDIKDIAYIIDRTEQSVKAKI